MKAGARELLLQARFVWLTFALAAALAAFLALPTQTLEYYQIFGEHAAADSYLRSIGAEKHPPEPTLLKIRLELAAALVLLLLCALAAAGCARAAEHAWRTHLAGGGAAEAAPDVLLARRWLPALIACIPIVAAFVGLQRAAGEFSPEAYAAQIELVKQTDPQRAGQLQSIVDVRQMAAAYLSQFSWWILAAAPPLFLLIAFLTKSDRREAGRRIAGLIGAPLLAGVMIAATLGLIALFAFAPVAPARAMGSIAIILMFFTALFYFTALLYVLSARLGAPLFNLLVIAALAFSLFDFGDNHELSRVDASARAAASGAGDCSALTAGDADSPAALPFRRWFCSRADKAHFVGRHYPVYVVAAQGGGLYAAAQTQHFLTSMQATCPSFAQHLFAVSSVSGGSVGSALFAAEARAYPNDDAVCPTIAERMTGEVTDQEQELNRRLSATLLKDYLSPVFAAAFFPDFAQRFIPYPIPAFSRANALEKALGQELDVIAASADPELQAEAPFSGAGVLSEWSPYDAQPALIFNTTETGAGRRRAIAPFEFGRSPGNDLRFVPVAAESDVPVVAAAIASARFPWILPAAWFAPRKPAGDAPSEDAPSKVRVVDGGYFENNGVATALDLIRDLEAAAQAYDLPVQIHLISLSSGGYVEQTFFGLGEALGPLRALISTREARTYSILDIADQSLGLAMERPAGGGADRPLKMRRLMRVELDTRLGDLPLGWRLSPTSLFQIARSVGSLKRCADNPTFRPGATGLAAENAADCAKQLIYRQLRAERFP